MAGRWAVLSDVHSNFFALDAVLADAHARGVDQVLCLGDVVGYGPEPHRCVGRLQEEVSDGAWVLGNHDEALCLLHNELPEEAPRAVRERIGIREETWIALRRNYELLRRYPPRLEHLAAQRTRSRIATRVSLVHGGHRHDEPTLTSVVAAEDARDEFHFLDRTKIGFDILLVGHTHRPAGFRQRAAGGEAFEVIRIEPPGVLELEDRRWVLNPGSVGQPRDGDPRASYMILDLERNVVEFRRVEYKLRKTQTTMEVLGLPGPLIWRLDPASGKLGLRQMEGATAR